MTKRFTVILFAVLFILQTAVPLPAASEPTISVSTAAAMPGDTVQLSVSLSGNPGINAFSLGFDYDAGKLQLLEVKPSKGLGGQFYYTKKAVWLNSVDSNMNGEILTIRLKVLDRAAEGVAQVGVTFSSGDISNYQEQDVYFANAPGGVFVGISQEALHNLTVLLKQLVSVIRVMKQLTVYKKTAF